MSFEVRICAKCGLKQVVNGRFADDNQWDYWAEFDQERGYPLCPKCSVAIDRVVLPLLLHRNDRP